MVMSFALSERSDYLDRSYRRSKSVISADPDPVYDTPVCSRAGTAGFSRVPTTDQMKADVRKA